MDYKNTLLASDEGSEDEEQPEESPGHAPMPDESDEGSEDEGFELYEEEEDEETE